MQKRKEYFYLVQLGIIRGVIWGKQNKITNLVVITFCFVISLLNLFVN